MSQCLELDVASQGETEEESLEQKILSAGYRVDRMTARLDMIAAGSHGVTRLVEWSERRNRFQEVSLARPT